MRRFFIMLACLSFVVFVVSCGGSSDPGGEDDNIAPVAQITNPTDGSIYKFDDTIQFSGDATDNEDGDLSGISLVWSSDVDGQIGTGQLCSTDSLTPGAHQIRLTATDSEGSSGADSIEVFIPALPDTGQTTSYTGTFGEDSDYTINPPHYTKLNSFGNKLPESAMDWSMVRDDVTCLIWEVKTEDGSVRDRDNYYTFQDANDVFIAQLNSDNFGGYSDWRLPTIPELSTLISPGVYEPAINTLFFPNTASDIHWSTTIYSSNTDKTWCVLFQTGSTEAAYYTTNTTLKVRAVRGEFITKDLVNNGDGTVSDVNIGLMWQQDEPGYMTWEEALTYCENLDLADHQDWRLPNLNELQSIINYESHDPAIETLFYPNTMSVFNYWSSTTRSEYPDTSMSISFSDGHSLSNLKSHVNYVRCVRGGSGEGGGGF